MSGWDSGSFSGSSDASQSNQFTGTGLGWTPRPYPGQFVFQHVNYDQSVQYDRMNQLALAAGSFSTRVASPRAWLHNFVSSTCAKGRELYA